DRGRRGPPGRERPGRHAGRPRVEARRRRRCGAESAVPSHADGADLRRDQLGLVDGEPKVLTLKEVLQSHVDHRVMIVRRRTEFDLRKARERLHIGEGLITAVDHLDEVIRLIRRARDAAEAEAGLTSRYLLSEAQAKAILAMALRQLTGLEIEKLRAEQTGLKKNIEGLEAILASREQVLDIIKAELLEMKEEYGDERRTKVEAEAFDMEIEDLIPDENVVVPITKTGY